MTARITDTRRRTAVGVLFLAALVGALGLGINLAHGPGGHAAVPQFDTLLFQQYARVFAEGHPYRFNPGDLPSTGSTSHLYPAVLAALCRAGLRGDALTTANLFLNFFLYLGAMALLFAIAWRLDRRAAPLAALLCALSGQTFISFFLLTDIGLFTFLALAALAAALAGRRAWLCAALVLAAWCRPEGFILSFFLLFGAFLPRQGARRRGWLLAGALGVGAFGGVMLLNHALTGSFQFQSVHNKGVVRVYGLAGGVAAAAAALAEFVSQGLLNLGHALRQFYAFPVLGAVLGLVGVATRLARPRPTARIEAWWGAAALAAVSLVAASGWDGIQFDKYWAWFLPVWTIYIAIGACAAARRLPWPRAGMLLAALLIAYQALGLAFFAADYGRACASVSPIVQSARRLGALLPPGARLACRGHSGLVYAMDGGRTLVNLDGICSPRFLTPEDPVQALELLRHEPALRFDAWLLLAPETEQWFKPLVGPQLAAAPPVFGGALALTLHRAVWDHVVDTTRPLAIAPPPGMRLADSLDVGYGPDEARCGYDRYTRVPGARIGMTVAMGRLGSRTLSEIGRVVIGMESFRLRLAPGRPARLVLRGMMQAEAPVLMPDGKFKSQAFAFTPPLSLNVLVDDQPAGKWVIASKAAEGEFFEAGFDIPGNLITTDSPLVTVGGDHIAFAYWAYQ